MQTMYMNLIWNLTRVVFCYFKGLPTFLTHSENAMLVLIAVSMHPFDPNILLNSLKAGRRAFEACTPSRLLAHNKFFLYLRCRELPSTAQPVQPNVEQMLGVFSFGLQILFSCSSGLRHAPAQVSKPQIISSQNRPAQYSKEKASLPKSGATPGASIPSTPQLLGDCTIGLAICGQMHMRLGHVLQQTVLEHIACDACHSIQGTSLMRKQAYCTMTASG